MHYIKVIISGIPAFIAIQMNVQAFALLMKLAAYRSKKKPPGRLRPEGRNLGVFT